MTTRTKRRIKRIIIATEGPCWALTIMGYPVTIVLLVAAAPVVTTLQLACLQLFIGFTASLGAWAGALKTADTDE